MIICKFYITLTFDIKRNNKMNMCVNRKLMGGCKKSVIFQYEFHVILVMLSEVHINDFNLFVHIIKSE